MHNVIVTISVYFSRWYVRINESTVSEKTGNIGILIQDSSSFRKIRARYENGKEGMLEIRISKIVLFAILRNQKLPNLYT